jgi:hypothetical protein
LLPILFRNGRVSLPLLIVPGVGREHDTGPPCAAAQRGPNDPRVTTRLANAVRQRCIRR